MSILYISIWNARTCVFQYFVMKNFNHTEYLEESYKEHSYWPSQIMQITFCYICFITFLSAHQYILLLIHFKISSDFLFCHYKQKEGLFRKDVTKLVCCFFQIHSTIWALVFTCLLNTTHLTSKSIFCLQKYSCDDLMRRGYTTLATLSCTE